MKILKLILLVIVILVCISAGIAKVMRMPQEVQFFEALGVNLILLTLLGLLQVMAGLLLIAKKTRRSGAILAALAFLASTVMIFANGQIGFGLFSLIPVALSLLFARRPSAE